MWDETCPVCANFQLLSLVLMRTTKSTHSTPFAVGHFFPTSNLADKLLCAQVHQEKLRSFTGFFNKQFSDSCRGMERQLVKFEFSC